MYRTNTKSTANCEHDATSVNLSNCTANTREDSIFAIIYCLTSVDISEIRLLIVSLDKMFFAFVSPKSNFAISRVNAFTRVSPMVWSFFCLAICNATSKEAVNLAVRVWEFPVLQKNPGFR